MTFRNTLRGIAVLAALATALAGCASGEGSSSAERDDEMTINVGQISDSVAFFPLFVAEEEGYFEEEGLTLGDRPRLGTGAKLAAALASGSIDLAGGVMTDAFNLAKSSRDPKLVANLVNQYYVDIIVGKDFSGPGDDADLMTKIKALRGKRIGITGPGSGTEALVTYLFALAGMDPSRDATLVNLGAEPSAVLGALSSGRVDALSFFQPIGQLAEAESIGEIYLSPAGGDVPQLRDVAHGVVFTTTEVLEQKPQAVAAFVRAIRRAEETVHGDPEKVAELMAAYQDNMDPQAVEALVPVLQEEIPETPEFDQASYRTAVEFHRTSGLFPSPPGYEEIVARDVISSA